MSMSVLLILKIFKTTLDLENENFNIPCGVGLENQRFGSGFVSAILEL